MYKNVTRKHESFKIFNQKYERASPHKNLKLTNRTPTNNNIRDDLNFDLDIGGYLNIFKKVKSSQ